jgi:glycosyltransferase involved in cell wall biosynthesis
VKLGILNWRDLAHPDSGGAEVFVHEVGRRWSAAGHNVTLYSSRRQGLDEHDEDEGMSIVRVGNLKTFTHHVRAPRLARRDKVDAIVESVNTFPYQLPLRTGALPPFLPLIHQMAVDVWDAHLPKHLASAARRLEPELFLPYRMTLVAAVSESTRADLIHAGIHRVVVIPQGGIGEQPKRQKEERPTILFVGRLIPNKRPDHAVKAFSLIRQALPDARLWVVGEGPMRARLEGQRSPGVEFLGRLRREDLLDRMGRAHVLLVTSIREGWGLVVTEANACGTPAVAYDIPGLRDSVVHEVTGILTKPDPRSLAVACRDLLGSSETWEVLAARARDWGFSRTWAHTADVLLAEIIAMAGTAPATVPAIS